MICKCIYSLTMSSSQFCFTRVKESVKLSHIPSQWVNNILIRLTIVVGTHALPRRLGLFGTYSRHEERNGHPRDICTTLRDHNEAHVSRVPMNGGAQGVHRSMRSRRAHRDRAPPSPPRTLQYSLLSLPLPRMLPLGSSPNICSISSIKSSLSRGRVRSRAR